MYVTDLTTTHVYMCVPLTFTYSGIILGVLLLFVIVLVVVIVIIVATVKHKARG